LGGCLLWAIFWKLQKWDTFWGYFLKRLLQLWRKNCLGYILGVFLQNHLVTLPPGKVSST
jgi:hypothetical protein